MVGGPGLELGVRQCCGHVQTVEVQGGRCGVDADGADDAEPDRDQRHDDGQAGGDAGQVEGDAGSSGGDQVAEHSFGQVD